MTYKLEKKIWTEADFEVMGWHDSTIYQIRLTEDLELDIDYILQWNEPDVEGLPFTFWMAPATLVFKKIRNLQFDLDVALQDCFEIDDIEKGDKNQWTILTQKGEMNFVSLGFEQFIRQEPSFQFGQTIPYDERQGFSLERTTNQENTNKVREDILNRRKQNLEYYENVKKRQLKRLELEQVIKARENNEIDTKQYFLKKKELNELIFSYDYFLKETQFEKW